MPADSLSRCSADNLAVVDNFHLAKIRATDALAGERHLGISRKFDRVTNVLAVDPEVEERAVGNKSFINPFLVCFE